MPHRLPPLPYDHDALEPHIDAKTMQIHHGKHHQGYVDKLNAALEGHDELQQLSIEDLLTGHSGLPKQILDAVRNNGGGHANHSLFWKIMKPGGGGEPGGELARALRAKFGGISGFRDAFKRAATGRFGSGWAWLVLDGDDGELSIVSTANQDSPLMNGQKPVLGLDVWEHAYYLRYQNRRGDYVDAWWNVVNWAQVAENFDRATASLGAASGSASK